MKWHALEEWLILTVFAGFTVAFIWYTKGASSFDLAFIWPLVVIIGVLCAVVALQLATARPAESVEAEVPDPDSTGEAGRKRMMFAGLMVLLLIGLSTVGMFTSLTIFMVAAMWVLGVRGWVTLTLVPLFLMGILYFCFVELLGVPISQSPLGLY